MNERVLAKNKTSATPPQATQASSPLLHQSSLTDELSESVGSNSNISKELGGIQPKIIRRSLNWQNINVEAPSRGNGMSLPGGIQRQQEEPGAVSSEGVSANSAQKSAIELSNSTISSDEPAQKPSIARTPFNGRNIPIEAPPRSAASSSYLGGIQRLETSGVKEQEESTESLQMQPEEEIQAKSSSDEPQEKEEPNQELVQTKLTVGAPGDKYEQEADSMAGKVMAMPEEAVEQPIQRQAEEQEQLQMQPEANSIAPLVQRQTEEDAAPVQMKPGQQRATDKSSVASGSLESRLADTKGGGSPLPDDVRSFMEARFKSDFSSVRVHTDSNAVQMTKELGAQAFAHGSDIYYGAGKSPGKNELTAHELTHTIQQTGGVPLNKSALPKPKPEQEEKQPLQAKKLSSSTPEVIQNKLATGIAARIQAKGKGTAAGNKEAPAAGAKQKSGQATKEPKIQVKEAPSRPITPTRLAGGNGGKPLAGAVSVLPPQQQARTIEASTGSVSWINPASPAGSGRLGVPDPAPPATISESFITGSSGFRFSNYLHGYLTTNDSVTIASAGLHSNSGIYTSPSQFGLPSDTFPIISSKTDITRGGIQGVQFNQLVGARTISAGVAAGTVGTTVGAGAGAFLGVKGGAAIGALGGPIGAVGGGIIGGLFGAAAGYLAGTTTANNLPQTNFPPIWTEIQLTIMADGTRDFHMLKHSLFPSHSFYSNPVGANTLVRTNNYMALGSQEKDWQRSGWGSGNPWGMNRPTFTP